MARRRAAVGSLCPISQYCDSRACNLLSLQALEKEEGRAVSGSEAVSVQLVSPTGAAAAVPVELVDGGTRFRCVPLKTCLFGLFQGLSSPSSQAMQCVLLTRACMCTARWRGLVLALPLLTNL